VLQQCRNDVAAFQQQTCADAPTSSVATACQSALEPCVAGGEQCKYLACLNQGANCPPGDLCNLGNYVDNRIQMVGQ
jgi:5'-nucleotidase